VPKPDKDDDLERELRSHLAAEAEEQREAGVSPLEARHAALRTLGNTTLIKEDTRKMWRWIWIEQLGQDLRYALRGFRRSAGFSVVALLSLALGIGATTALFSVVYGVLISPYPYAKPNEIWAPAVTGIKDPPRGWHPYSRRELLEIQKMPAFADTMATVPSQVLLTGKYNPENVTGVLLTGGGFNFLGVKPVIGRTIQPYDIGPGGEPAKVAVLSYGFWQRIFSGRPDALGRQLVLNDEPYTVIGVMPSRFGWWTDDGLWLPMPMDARDPSGVNAIMRLAPGVSKSAAEQQLHSLNRQLAASHPQDFPKGEFRTQLLNYMDITVASGEMSSSLMLLLAAVGFLLLIACVNVANLQLARTTARAREIAMRLSIGATRRRLVRQLLAESVLLSLFGGVLGILIAIGMTKGIVALMPSFYVPNEARITVNSWVLLFSFVISVATGILFGLVPAWQCSRPNLVDALKDGGKGSGAGIRGKKTRRALVIAEVALSVILLAGASMAIRNFAGLLQTDPGFHPERTLTIAVTLPPKQYKTIEQRNAFDQELVQRVTNLPGVRAVAIGNGGMPFGGPRSTYSLEGVPAPQPQRIIVGLISSGYTQTLGIPLKRGREFTQREVAHGDHVALINETAAKLWPVGEEPIGKRVKADILAKSNSPQVLMPQGSTGDVTVVGILRDTKNAGLRNPVEPAIYVPYTLVAPPTRILAIRTAGEPLLFLNSLRQTLREMDKTIPLGRPFTVEQALGTETVQPRFNMALFSAFAALGLALAAAGIYSVISYDVAQRVHEIGVRMALGANRMDVLGMVLKMAARVVAIGLAIGLGGSVLLVRLIQFQVFAATPFDPLSGAAVVLVLASVALLASWSPAHRAAKLHPVAALRHEA
jgi:putative ABC transport system permease protein